MKKRISIIMLLTISVLMTGCEELHKKPLAYIETNADDRQSETSETETKKKKETEPLADRIKVFSFDSLNTLIALTGNGSRGSGRAGQLGNRTSGNGDRI